MKDVKDMEDMKKMEEIFHSMDKEDLMSTTGGGKREIPGWVKLMDVIGGTFNDVTRNMGY